MGSAESARHTSAQRAALSPSGFTVQARALEDRAGEEPLPVPKAGPAAPQGSVVLLLGPFGGRGHFLQLLAGPGIGTRRGSQGGGGKGSSPSPRVGRAPPHHLGSAWSLRCQLTGQIKQSVKTRSHGAGRGPAAGADL